MTRTSRALRAARRNDEAAAALRAAARTSGPATAPDQLREAERHERTAAEWRRIAAGEAEPRIERKECCDAPVEEPCEDSCACSDCENDRAAEEDADAYFGNCR